MADFDESIDLEKLEKITNDVLDKMDGLSTADKMHICVHIISFLMVKGFMDSEEDLPELLEHLNFHISKVIEVNPGWLGKAH